MNSNIEAVVMATLAAEDAHSTTAENNSVILDDGGVCLDSVRTVYSVRSRDK